MTGEPDGDAWGPAIDGMDDSAQTDETETTTGGQSDRLDSLMPDDSDTDNDGRTGLLSTRIEVHALVIGMMIGVTLPAAGLVEYIAAVVGGGAVGSRFQKTIPKKYVEQVKAELPYFIAGVVIGYVGARSGMALPLSGLL